MAKKHFFGSRSFYGEVIEKRSRTQTRSQKILNKCVFYEGFTVE